MFATAVLRSEHDVILKMLDATDEVGRRLLSGEKVAAEILSELLAFFRLFADRCHHGKEEDLLFPLLEKKGIPRGGGPIGVMLFEHESGRELIQEMDQAASQFQTNPGVYGPRWARAAAEYTNLLREHIAKENNVLFRMAENLLTTEEQEKLAQEFEGNEREKLGAGASERLRSRSDQLLAEISKSHN